MSTLQELEDMNLKELKALREKKAKSNNNEFLLYVIDNIIEEKNGQQRQR